MTQDCQVYINIETNTEEDKEKIVKYLKETFKRNSVANFNDSHMDIEIVDDMPNLIVLDAYIEYELYFVAGSPATRYEPGEPAYFEDVLVKDDFYMWTYTLLKQGHFDFDYSIDIDEDSSIPKEEELMERYYEEETYRDEY